MENIDQRIEKLTDFLGLLDAWEEEHPEEIRSRISRARPSVQREVLEAGCLHTITVSPHRQLVEWSCKTLIPLT